MGVISKIFSFVARDKRKEEIVKRDVSVTPADNDLVDKLRAEISDLKCQLQDKSLEAKEALIQKQSDHDAEAEILKSEINELRCQLASGTFDGGEEIIQKLKSDNEAQINKLKREIDDLQDELDDAESDLRKAKKSIEEKNAYNEELEDKLTRMQRSMNDLSSELDSRKEELEDKSFQLSLTSSSLSSLILLSFSVTTSPRSLPAS